MKTHENFRVKHFFHDWKLSFFRWCTPKIKWSTIRAMGYSLKFWGNSLSTLQLHGWLGRVLYSCCMLAFLDWNFNKNQWIFYCNRPSCLLGCTIKSKLSPTSKKKKTTTTTTKKQKNAKFSIVFKRINIRIKVRRKKKINVKERLVSKPTQNELYEFLSGLNQTEKKPGILWVVPGFANNFRHKFLDLSEQMLTSLYDTAHTILPRDKLLELSQET